MSASISIERAGLQTLVVDAGRFGYRHEGIAWCGPADALAYAAANALVLAGARDAALEIAMGDVAIRFRETRAFALTGADCDALLDGARCTAWAKHVAEAGSTLTLRPPKSGVYTYVAFAGGVDVPIVLGSRTTDRVAGIGGCEGRALRSGDEVALGEPAVRAGASFSIAPPRMREVVRVLPGGEIDRFDDASVDMLFARRWSIGHESNRMGYRLHGDALVYRGEELPSHAVFPGVIQVPSAGEPIVLLADAHTTGGYPKAGVVFEADLRIVAQSRPGETLRFVAEDRVEALAASQRRVDYLQALRELARERTNG